MADATPYSDQKNWSNDYLTDRKIIKALGPFEIDVACPATMPWRTAKKMFHYPKIDGLAVNWDGRRAFMNPPYRGVLAWARKFSANGNGIALLNGRSTETQASQIIMESSRAIFFPKGRLTFYKVSGKPWEQKWFPSLLIGMTAVDAMLLRSLRDQIGGIVYERRPNR